MSGLAPLHPIATLVRQRFWQFNFQFNQAVRQLNLGLGMATALLCGVGLAEPARAAEQIYISYGLLETSVSIESLNLFASKGIVRRDLATYTRYITPAQLQDLQRLLSSRVVADEVAVAQFLYTPQGEVLLERLGEVVQTESRRSGFSAIRAALILAAADETEGLTPLNVLDKFPLASIRLDVERSLEIAQQIETLIQQTNQAIATIEQQSALEAATAPVTDFSQLPDLRQPSTSTWLKQSLDLVDERRDRAFAADLYLPVSNRPQLLQSPVPLVVISHGLGSDRSSYAYLAEHLASYGFAVAVLEHPGSNAEQLQALISGQDKDLAKPSEFIDRPLDVTFLLDRLAAEAETSPDWQRPLDLENVALIGQSFGAYTALAVAGAEMNLSQLQADCEVGDFLNLSLLLQCRALDVADGAVNLRDERVKAVIAINLVGSSVFGQTGYGQVNVPILMVTANTDTVAPSLLEQIFPFTWLGSADRYLAMLQGASHFSTIGEAPADSGAVPLPPAIIGPDPTIARRYLNALSVAFLDTYLNGDSRYTPQLSSSYARFISQTPLPLRLVKSFTATQLAKALQTDAMVEVVSYKDWLRVSDR